MLAALSQLALGFTARPLQHVRVNPASAVAVMMATPDDAGECIRLEKEELPDAARDAVPDGQWYACDKPPEEEANMQCYQPSEGKDGQPGTTVDGKPWVCIDSTALQKPSDDSY